MFGILPYTTRTNSLVNQLTRSFLQEDGRSLRHFATDIRDRGDHFLLEADIPGFTKDEISLDLKEDILTISATRNQESEDAEQGYLRRERRSASYARAFNVSGIDQTGIEANYDNGVLTLRLPKENPVIPESRKIPIG